MKQHEAAEDVQFFEYVIGRVLDHFLHRDMWSDPQESDAETAWGVHGNPRGPTVKQFGTDITEKFCKREACPWSFAAISMCDESSSCITAGG